MTATAFLERNLPNRAMIRKLSRGMAGISQYQDSHCGISSFSFFITQFSQGIGIKRLEMMIHLKYQEPVRQILRQPKQ